MHEGVNKVRDFVRHMVLLQIGNIVVRSVDALLFKISGEDFAFLFCAGDCVRRQQCQRKKTRVIVHAREKERRCFIGRLLHGEIGTRESIDRSSRLMHRLEEFRVPEEW